MVNIWPFFSQVIGSVCPLCQQPGADFCPHCIQSLPYNRHPCPYCALPLPAESPAGIACHECQSDIPSFDRVLAPLLYQPPVDGLVAGFKYHHRLHLGPMLAHILADAVGYDEKGIKLLLPVPMQAHGLRERGFNQAAELTRCLSMRLGIPWATAPLIRIRGSDHQQTLKRRQRQRNVRGVFSCRGTLPAQVALIDDVMTTGATAEEASRILKAAGVERVEVWTVARTPRDRCN